MAIPENSSAAEARAWAYVYSTNRPFAERIIRQCKDAVASFDRADAFAPARAETHLRCGVTAPEDYLSDPYNKNYKAAS